MTKENKQVALVMFFLYIIVRLARAYIHVPLITYGEVVVRTSIQLWFVYFWCALLRKRIINPAVNDRLLQCGILMAFWLLIRLMKWRFVFEEGLIHRFCWYAYYIPIILIPYICAMLVEYLNTPNDYHYQGKKRYLLLPGIFLILLVFTNDLHQWVFRFPVGIHHYNTYSYGWGFFLMMLWWMILGVYCIIRMMQKSNAPGKTYTKLLPSGILLLASAYWILYGNGIVQGDMVAINCLVIVALIESAIFTGLIQSNSRYEELFVRSSIGAKILDEKDQVIYESENAKDLPIQVMQQWDTDQVDEGNYRFSRARIRGGSVYWKDDITQIQEKLSELENLQQALKKQNEILQSELSMKEQKAKIVELEEIYDNLSSASKKQILELRELLQMPEEEMGRDEFSRMCILGAYVKRRGNLMLLERESEYVLARELELSLSECLSQLRLRDALVSFDSQCQGEIPIASCMALLDRYEEIVESYLDRISAVLVHLHMDSEDISMKLQIGFEEEDAFFDIKVPRGGAL